ncbi:protein cholesin [Physeter macrocephalus]|uniref:Protein cholesin n=1 Tax=Physeter macrocephalus TaxID=9755 RepID=A0A9W2X3H2_PHYMC|nr:uncharacterized protein C7orf50 homolog [Physeter catodon]
MAKQKRKESQVTEKKNKKLKKAAARETPLAPAAPPGTEGAPAEVPDKHFSTLLAYLEGLRGRARELPVQKAEVLMRELDEAGASADAPLPGRTQRVRQVL